MRSELEETDDVEKVSTSTDTKGRQQPVHKPKAVSVKPPLPPTPAQRAEEKIRQAAIADKKKHGELSLARVMEEVVTTADREELVALAKHSAPERHVRACAECEKNGIDWKPTSSAEQTAEDRKALYAATDTSTATNGEQRIKTLEQRVAELEAENECLRNRATTELQARVAQLEKALIEMAPRGSPSGRNQEAPLQADENTPRVMAPDRRPNAS